MIRLTIKLIDALFKFILYCFLLVFQFIMALIGIITCLAQIILKFSTPIAVILSPFVAVAMMLNKKLKESIKRAWADRNASHSFKTINKKTQ